MNPNTTPSQNTNDPVIPSSQPSNTQSHENQKIGVNITQPVSNNSPNQSAPTGTTIGPEIYRKVLKYVHITSMFAIILGILEIVAQPLLLYATYKSKVPGVSRSTLIIEFTVISVIIGGVYIALGLQLKKIALDTFNKAMKPLRITAFSALVVVVMSFIFVGGVAWLLNIILLFFAVTSIRQIVYFRLNK